MRITLWNAPYVVAQLPVDPDGIRKMAKGAAYAALREVERQYEAACWAVISRRPGAEETRLALVDLIDKIQEVVDILERPERKARAKELASLKK